MSDPCNKTTDKFAEARKMAEQDDAAGYPPEGVFQTTVDPENIMREIWNQYRADNPDVEAWDAMSETERKVMRRLALAAGRLK